MCLIAFAWRAYRDYRLVVAANRDEYFRRPAAPAGFWDDHHFVLAGRDLEAGGTWLGITLQGRFAAITNYRNPADRRSGAPTRGRLVSDYLAGTQAPREYVAAVGRKASQYNGFSMLAGDLETMCFVSNRADGGVLEVSPGVHALSNHLLDTPWPKVEKGKAKLEAALGRPFDAEALLAAFDDTETTNALLPDTGVGPELEERLSAIRIVPHGGYGTRCSTVLAIAENGRVEFYERSYREDGRPGNSVRYRFTLASPPPKDPASSRRGESRPRRTPLPAR